MKYYVELLAPDTTGKIEPILGTDSRGILDGWLNKRNREVEAKEFFDLNSSLYKNMVGYQIIKANSFLENGTVESIHYPPPDK